MSLPMDGWMEDAIPFLRNILTGIRIVDPKVFKNDVRRVFEFLQYENRAIGRFTWWIMKYKILFSKQLSAQGQAGVLDGLSETFQ